MGGYINVSLALEAPKLREAPSQPNEGNSMERH